MYCTAADVYRISGITSAEVTEDDINEHILDAEKEVDRFTNSTWWHAEDSGSVASATSNTLTVAATPWTVNAFSNEWVWIYEGTAIGEFQLIISNTSNVLTISEDWAVEPDNTSKYRIIHTGSDPVRTETRNGDNTNVIYTERGPMVNLISAEVDGTAVDVSEALIDYAVGEVDIANDNATARWAVGNQKNSLTYWWGHYDRIFERTAKTLCACYAGISALGEQMGGTHNIPSTYSLPEGSVSIGQAYVNIKGTVDVLGKKTIRAEKLIPKFHTFV